MKKTLPFIPKKMAQRGLFLFSFILSFGSANAQDTFHNPDSVFIPERGTVPIPGQPYPSTLDVSGVKGVVTHLSVTLYNFQHNFPAAVDLLLVAPDGSNAIILSDVGGARDILGINITLTDSAATSLPEGTTFGAGTYQPTNIGLTGDSWPAPAPAPSGQSALSTFEGIQPNGTWRLYAVSDIEGAYGWIAGGWSLTITTNKAVNPAPVNNLSAVYNPQANKVQLSWFTSSETNTAYFVVERSTNGSAWQSIDTVAAAGTSLGRRDYQYTDAAVTNAFYHYRVRLVTRDGQSATSNEAPVVVYNPNSYTVFPNPAHSFTYVQSPSQQPENITVTISNSSGPLLQKQGSSSRYSPLRIELSNLPPGTYYLTITKGNTQTTQVLSIVR